MTFAQNSREGIMGALAESEAASIIQRRGLSVLPVFKATDNNEATSAPMMMLAKSDIVVAPDLLCFGGEGVVWIDVKGKAVPTWRRTHGRWEHGIDFSLFTEYERVAEATNLPVWLLVREERIPETLAAESALVDGINWMAIRLTDARTYGERRHEWPGGASEPRRRGRFGLGGWLWPRTRMTMWNASVLDTAASTDEALARTIPLAWIHGRMRARTTAARASVVWCPRPPIGLPCPP